MPILSLCLAFGAYLLVLAMVFPTQNNNKAKKYRYVYRIRKDTYGGGYSRYYVEERFGSLSWEVIHATLIEEEAREILARVVKKEEERLEEVKKSEVIKSEILK